MKVIKTYETNDGRVFTNLRNAKYHEAGKAIEEFVASKNKSSVSSEEFIRFIYNNQDELRELLNGIRSTLRGLK